jgi:GNAT superfamily N-acetyltransferase
LADAIVAQAGALLRGRVRRHATLRALLRSDWRWLWGDWLWKSSGGLQKVSSFPAHLHLQIDPEHRGGRIGLALTLAFEAYAKRAGAAGQHSRVVERQGEQRYSEMLMALGAEVVEETTFTRRERPSLIDDGVWVERVLVRRYRG